MKSVLYFPLKRLSVTALVNYKPSSPFIIESNILAVVNLCVPLKSFDSTGDIRNLFSYVRQCLWYLPSNQILLGKYITLKRSKCSIQVLRDLRDFLQLIKTVTPIDFLKHHQEKRIHSMSIALNLLLYKSRFVAVLID